jgi:hypothetical protein
LNSFGQPTQSNKLSPAAGRRARTITITLPFTFGVGQIGAVTLRCRRATQIRAASHAAMFST